jgi:hypothetical protein
VDGRDFAAAGACLIRLFNFRSLTLHHFSPAANALLREHWQHISRVGSAEVLAMASNNLPTMLINVWFSPLVAGYFSVVSRFCLSPVMIIGNAVRNSIFSKWSMDFRNNTFNYPEYKKVRLLLMGGRGVYPRHLDFLSAGDAPGFSQEWLNSIPPRAICCLICSPLAVSPLTVIELIFGSRRYSCAFRLSRC